MPHSRSETLSSKPTLVPTCLERGHCTAEASTTRLRTMCNGLGFRVWGCSPYITVVDVTPGQCKYLSLETNI